MNLFNTRKPRPEHIEKLLECIQPKELITPFEIVKRTGLTLTAVYGAISTLEFNKKIVVIRQDKTPKLRVGQISNS